MSHLSEDQLDDIIDRERTRELSPLNDWRTIAARAREEGLLRESQTAVIWGSARPWLQAAAAVLILVGGITIGRTTSALPSAANMTAAISEPAIPATNAPLPATITPASASFASVDDAAATLDRAVRDYQRASQFLAANNTTAGTIDSVSIYAARVAALNKIQAATERALQTAPHDPVINQYYLATMGARVATEQMVARPVALKGF